MTEYLDLVDYLLIAEAVTGIQAEVLAKLPRIGLAESALHAPQASFGEVEFYPEFTTKAAVLLIHLLRNHPLPDGNKRAAWLAMREFLGRNGWGWESPPVAEAEAVVVQAASGELEPAGLAQWIDRYIRPAS